MNRFVTLLLLGSLLVAAPSAEPLWAQDARLSESIEADLLEAAGDAPTRTRGPAPALTADNVGVFFDAAFDVQRQEHELVGAVVSVVYQGEVLFKRGYGFADLEARAPADPDRSLFRIASITKTFVWTALMQLVEQGRVDLDADVNQYLDFRIPDTFDEPIRVWHLMTHTPGFEESWIGWGAREAGDVQQLGVELERLMPARVWEPGKYAAYSNYGAALAGYIVERVSGQAWDTYLEEHVLEPLGMSSTNVRLVMTDDHRARHAKGYRYRGSEYVASDYQWLRLLPAGHMSATAADMARFMLVHLGHGAVGDVRIMQETTARQMQSPLFDPHPDVRPLLHGFYRSDRNGEVVFGHGGDVNQFHSNMSLLPERGLGVFVSYNSDPGAAARSQVVSAFLDHFFPSEYLRPAPAPADIELADYHGRYIPLRGPFTTIERIASVSADRSVWSDGDDLRVGPARLVPVGPDRFTGMYRDQGYVFLRDEDGEVTHAISGSALSTARRIGFFQSSDTLSVIVAAMYLIALAAVGGGGERLFRPAPEERRLPSPHVRAAWVHALLLVAGPIALGLASESLFYGMTPVTHLVLLAVNANLALGLAVLAFCLIQWVRGHGSRWVRVRYSLVALASLTNLWLLWSFNVVGYLT